MKKNPLILLLALSAILVTAGCSRDHKGHEHDGEHEHASATEEGVTFSEKSGLSIPKETAQLIGLAIIEVEEREIAGKIELSLQVYGHKSGKALATGFSPAQKDLASVKNLSLKDFPEEGTIVKQSRLAELTELLVEIPDPSKTLSVGLSIVAFATVGQPQKVPTVPQEALLKTIEGSFVYTLSGEHFVRTAVKVGAENENFAEITDGLYTGDQVAVRPVMTLWLAELQTIRGGKACADGH